MAMTKRSDIGGKIVSQSKARSTSRSPKGSPSPTPTNQRESPSRLSPGRGTSVKSPVPSPRSSPGLLAYASCKFSEPPSASALPLPPKHWVQANRSVMLPFQATAVSCVKQHHDFTQQLKLLLKVQA